MALGFGAFVIVTDWLTSLKICVSDGKVLVVACAGALCSITPAARKMAALAMSRTGLKVASRWGNVVLSGRDGPCVKSTNSTAPHGTKIIGRAITTGRQSCKHGRFRPQAVIYEKNRTPRPGRGMSFTQAGNSLLTIS